MTAIDVPPAKESGMSSQRLVFRNGFVVSMDPDIGEIEVWDDKGDLKIAIPAFDKLGFSVDEDLAFNITDVYIATVEGAPRSNFLTFCAPTVPVIAAKTSAMKAPT